MKQKFLILLIGVCAYVPCFAHCAYAKKEIHPAQRQILVESELNCLSQHLDGKEISWRDVCSIDDFEKEGTKKRNKVSPAMITNTRKLIQWNR